jgi:16S rRNA G527 N7-methylase RsmG
LLLDCLSEKQQQVAKSIQKSKQRLLNLYMNAQADKNHELNVKSLEEELDYLIRHIQNKATICAKTKR